MSPQTVSPHVPFSLKSVPVRYLVTAIRKATNADQNEGFLVLVNFFHALKYKLCMLEIACFSVAETERHLASMFAFLVT